MLAECATEPLAADVHSVLGGHLVQGEGVVADQLLDGGEQPGRRPGVELAVGLAAVLLHRLNLFFVTLELLAQRVGSAICLAKARCQHKAMALQRVLQDGDAALEVTAA